MTNFVPENEEDMNRHIPYHSSNMESLIYHHMNNINYAMTLVNESSSILNRYILFENRRQYNISRNLNQRRNHHQNSHEGTTTNSIPNTTNTTNMNSNNLHNANHTYSFQSHMPFFNTQNTNRTQTQNPWYNIPLYDVNLNTYRTPYSSSSSVPSMSPTNTFPPRHHSNNDQLHDDQQNTYVFRFDTLIPNIFESALNSSFREAQQNINNNQYTYTRLTIDENNKYLIHEPSNTYDILDITHYEYVDDPINDICPITRERFYNNQNVLMINNCKHIFNKSSLNLWIRNHNTCPSCRRLIHQHSSQNANDSSAEENES